MLAALAAGLRTTRCSGSFGRTTGSSCASRSSSCCCCCCNISAASAEPRRGSGSGDAGTSVLSDAAGNDLVETSEAREPVAASMRRCEPLCGTSPRSLSASTGAGMRARAAGDSMAWIAESSGDSTNCCFSCCRCCASTADDTETTESRDSADDDDSDGRRMSCDSGERERWFESARRGATAGENAVPLAVRCTLVERGPWRIETGDASPRATFSARFAQADAPCRCCCCCCRC